MSGKGMFRLWVAMGVLWAIGATAEAGPPWGNLLSSKSIAADPDKTYALNEENGPWMILATSFSGQGAEKQANELVYELRKRYKLPAYVHRCEFDPGEAQGLGIDKYGNPRKFAYQRYKDKGDPQRARHPKLVEIAVLVGNYPTVGDKDAKATLDKIKYAKPQCLEVKEGKATNQTLTGWRMLQQKVYELAGSEKKDFGPMRHAILAPNPLLPTDYYTPKIVDDDIAEMNKVVPHSLLDCKGRYTVRIATFKGNAAIRQGDIRDIQEGHKDMQSRLATAAQNAYDLTIYLRAQGKEAYQFHDRSSSIVTVGSFQSFGIPQINGQTEPDPEIRRIIDEFRATSADPRDQTVDRNLRVLGRQDLSQQALAVKPQWREVLKDVIVPLDAQPMIVQVPKRSIGGLALRSE
jgi:hypothetical protein